jgi:hypothetical protein
MKITLLRCLALCLGLLAPLTAHAEEKLMELWPNQRAKHFVQSQDAAARYEARGQNYVDHLYTTGGESPIEPAADYMADGQPEIDPVPVDVNQVSQIVGTTEGTTIEDPSKTPAPKAP